MIRAKWMPGDYPELVIPFDETPADSECPVGTYGEGCRKESELSALFSGVIVGVLLDSIAVFSFCSAWRKFC